MRIKMFPVCVFVTVWSVVLSVASVYSLIWKCFLVAAAEKNLTDTRYKEEAVKLLLDLISASCRMEDTSVQRLLGESNLLDVC